MKQSWWEMLTCTRFFKVFSMQAGLSSFNLLDPEIYSMNNFKRSPNFPHKGLAPNLLTAGAAAIF
jgi:hypothetical protein